LANLDYFYRADAILFLFALGIGAIVYKFNEWFKMQKEKRDINV
jgi:hypothetical protein